MAVRSDCAGCILIVRVGCIVDVEIRSRLGHGRGLGRSIQRDIVGVERDLNPQPAGSRAQAAALWNPCEVACVHGPGCDVQQWGGSVRCVLVEVDPHGRIGRVAK